MTRHLLYIASMFSASSIIEGLAKFLKLDGLVENLSGYVEARVKLIKIEVREEVSKAITRGLIFAVIALLAFLFIVFLSIGGALFLNQYFADSYGGFFIVAAFYLLLFIMAIAFRKQIYQKLEHIFNEKLQHKQ